MANEIKTGLLSDQSALKASSIRSLYVHVPFCAHKCEYCAFFSARPQGDDMDRYVRALETELELVAPELQPHTIYFGGGTPTLLTLKHWERLLQTFHRLKLAGAAEWTVEANPATITLDKVRLLREYGVNRMSMGIQSLDENLLARLGRIHSREQAFKAFDTLRQAGFDNLNIDLMFAIPGQTMAVWEATLAEALAFGSEHLSSYEVIYEEDTPLYEQLQASQSDANQELACDMYETLIARAQTAGFHQYEIANFGRHQGAPDFFVPSSACQHNVNYWRGGAFHGLGPGASGFVGGVRTKNFANTRRYCQLLEKNERAIESRDELSPLARAGEIAGFGLRMTAGWRWEEFANLTGFDLRQEWSAEMQELIAHGYGEKSDAGFRLTPRGLRYADWAIELFLRP